MAPNLSKLVQKLDKNPKIFGLLSSLGVAFWIYSSLSTVNPSRYELIANKNFIVEPKSDNTFKKVQVDAKFFKSLTKILKIIIPNAYSKEMGYVVMVAVTLFFRSFCDIWLINNATLVEGAIISQNWSSFLRNLRNYIISMPTLSIVNNLLRFSLQELKLRFRLRLTNNLYDQYLREFTYYKMNNLDNRISNVDQLLTQDVEKFCNSVVDVYSNISKPLLDVIIYLQNLSSSLGLLAMSPMVLYLLLSGTILTRMRRPLAKLTAMEQKLEGEFRYVNSRLITNCEEVAFYRGNERESYNLKLSFSKLVSHLRKIIDFKFSMGFVDNIIAKYFALCMGFCVIGFSFLRTNSSFGNTGHQFRMEEYYKNGRMLIKLGEAIGRLVLGGRELTKLAGFTSRVQELLTVLNDVNKGKFQRSAIDCKDSGLVRRQDGSSGDVVIADNIIRFENVPLVTPNGDILVKELNFEVKSGMNVLVCGPNGCGKSSLFRILGELWPVIRGVMTKPSAEKLFYIPQRPYMTLGNLRDQVIYPDLKSDMDKKGRKDADLVQLLERVQLSYVLEREGAWDAVADWMDVLSGGEKQRVAMARLFYHKPQFAILDECTSAVSVDVEGEIYRYCKAVGITLFTVSHRKSLWKHHEYYLHMDGRGSFEFLPINAQTMEFGS